MSTSGGQVWRLHHDGDVVAELHVTKLDQPVLHARVAPRPGFDRVAQLFADDARLLDDVDGRPDEWARVQDAIRAATRLTDDAGRDVPEYLLHIDGDHAWWRWSDEAFGTDG